MCLYGFVSMPPVGLGLFEIWDFAKNIQIDERKLEIVFVVFALGGYS